MDTLHSSETESPSEIANGAPARTLKKGLFLLGLFEVDHPEWTLKELRERAGLPKATTRRLVKTLEASKWVAYDPTSRKYHLGSSALRAFYLATSHLELVRVSHPFLVKLAEETTESSLLSVWTDQGALILDTVPTGRAFKPYTSVGMLLPGLASADAQVLVAFSPEDAWEALLAMPLERRTENTITDPERLRERWLTIKRERVAFDWEEWKQGAPAVAAPVFDQSGQVRAAVTVVAPIERCSEAEMMKYAAAVTRTAADLSRVLGYQASHSIGSAETGLPAEKGWLEPSPVELGE